MPSLAIFSKDKPPKRWISLKPDQTAGHMRGRFIKSVIPFILIVGITICAQGCAANKCDCPKFGGHHLNH